MAEPIETDFDALIAWADPDRWLSSRFIGNPQARADVITLYAFDYELARAPRVATNALMGEIRLTWWREVLDEVFEGRSVRHHPTAQALSVMIVRHQLSRAPLEALIEARYRELDPEPMSLEDALHWADATGGGVAELAARILHPKSDMAKARAGGRAWSIGMLMGTAGLIGADAQQALLAALSAAKGLSVEAFPAVAHATLARLRARRLRPGALNARLRVTWAVLCGRV